MGWILKNSDPFLVFFAISLFFLTIAAGPCEFTIQTADSIESKFELVKPNCATINITILSIGPTDFVLNGEDRLNLNIFSQLDSGSLPPQYLTATNFTSFYYLGSNERGWALNVSSTTTCTVENHNWASVTEANKSYFKSIVKLYINKSNFGTMGIQSGDANDFTVIGNIYVSYCKFYYVTNGMGPLNNCGTIFIDHSEFVRNTAFVHSGTLVFTSTSLSNFTDVSDRNQIIGKVGDLTFSNCNLTDNVGSIEGNVVIFTDSRLIRNLNGGLITHTRATISHSLFKECDTTKNGTSTLQMSGTIHQNVDSCTFLSNKGMDGGAINAKSNTNLIIQNSIFINNSAINEGGAILGQDSDFEVKGCTFTDNWAILSGGAIESKGKLRLSQSSFLRNNASVGGSIRTVDLVAVSSNFTGSNINNGAGGAIKIQQGNLANTTIDNCRFMNNYAFKGGAVFATNLLVKNSVFESNDGSYGSAIYTDLDLILYRSQFTNNRATNAIISVQGVLNRTESCQLWNNVVDTDSPIVAPSTRDVVLSSFRNNRGGSSGVFTVSFATKFSSCEFLNNSGTNGGAIQGMDLEILNSTFVGNTAASNGGAVLATQVNSTMNEFRRNSAKYGGGSIHAVYLKANTTVFDSNEANNGGAVYMEGSPNSSCIVENSVLVNNSVISLGGGLFVNTGDLVVQYSNFSGNRAFQGGAIYGRVSQVVGSEFSFNSATSASAILSSSSIEVVQSQFYDNHAVSDSTVRTISNFTSRGTTIFKRNVAEMGAAIYATGGVNITEGFIGGDNHNAFGVSNEVCSAIYSANQNILLSNAELHCDWLSYGANPIQVSVTDQIPNQKTGGMLTFYARRPGVGPASLNIDSNRFFVGGSLCKDIQYSSQGYFYTITCDASSIAGKDLLVSYSDWCFSGDIFINQNEYYAPTTKTPSTTPPITVPPTLPPPSTALPTTLPPQTEPPKPDTQVKEEINKIVNDQGTNSSVPTSLYSTITTYFNSTANATNPLIVSKVEVSVAAFDVSKKTGDSISLSLDLYNSSTNFPTSVLDEILNGTNAVLIFTTYEKIESQFSVPIPRQGSIVYGLTLVSEGGAVIRVENSSSSITLSLSLLSGLSNEDIDDLDCLWWDELESQWRNEGCRRKSINERVIECECNHLTNFTAGSLTKKNQAVVNPSNPSSSPVAAIAGAVVGGFVLLVIIVVIVAIILKRRSKMRQSNTELFMLKDEEGAKCEVIMEEKIGTGAFSVVYRATDSGTTAVAVKKLNPKEDRKKFVMEANILKGLHHPNIVQYLRTFEDAQGSLCMVLEYMSGGNLLSLLQSQKLPFENKLKIAMDVIGALRYLESNSIIHADISARNVLIREGPLAKLSDFGLARYSNQSETKPGEKSPIRWSAPEVLKSQRYSHKSDAWMFGVLLWELWNDGKIPYGDMTNEQIIKFVCEGGKLFPSKDNTHEFLNIIQSCNEEENKRIGFEEISSRLSSMNTKFVSKVGLGVAQDDCYVGSQ
eukprot:TRINITY_DN1762_c0_g1_i1.p1 TRINITY_DN1762_c0_g1~~TRINITY_DN1762_c0_g1_i1.p1  ORF type:complete len:1507 (+),score=384.01 TRINITY_DN1762_c0_g1_i1:39-4523(+)